MKIIGPRLIYYVLAYVCSILPAVFSLPIKRNHVFRFCFFIILSFGIVFVSVYSILPFHLVNIYMLMSLYASVFGDCGYSRHKLASQHFLFVVPYSMFCEKIQ